MDILGPLPTAPRGNKYVLVVAGYFSKWAEAYPPFPRSGGSDGVERFVCCHSVPQSLHIDQGRNFESQLFCCICDLLEI